MGNVKVKDKRIMNTVIVFFINFLLSVLFYRSHYWTEETTFDIKVRTYIVCVFLLIVFPLMSYLLKNVNAMIGKAISKIKEKLKSIYAHKKQIFHILVEYLLVAIISYVFSRIIVYGFKIFNSGYEYNIIVYASILTGGFVLYTFWKFRNCAYEKLDKLFLAVGLIGGIFFCTVVPAEVGISWDDEIHHNNVENIVDYFSGVSFKANELLYDEYQQVAVYHYGYSVEDRNTRAEAINKSFENKETVEYEQAISTNFIGYTPHILGTFIGRGLSLSYTATFRLGRYLSMLCYVVLVSLAIKRIRTGRVLISVIGLFPTNLYMAGSYSYDPWLIGFSLLGFSIFFDILQRNEKFSNDDLAKILVCLFLAFLTKPVYFPALFMLLFVPKDRFESEKQRKIYLAFVFITAILLALAIIAPMVFSGNGFGDGDKRWSDEADSNGQIQYILQNPLSFAKMMANFLFNSYLLPTASCEYIQNMAYMTLYVQQPVVIKSLSMIIFFTVALLDRNGIKLKTKTIVWTGLFGILCAIFLVASALYVSITPVGADSVAGVQYRYLTPMLFPSLYLIGFDSVEHKINKNLLAIIPMLFMITTFVFWTGGNVYVGYSNFYF